MKRFLLRAIYLTTMSLSAALLISVNVTHAKKKEPPKDPFGCTASQIQSPAGKRCTSKAAKRLGTYGDTIWNYVLTCNTGSLKCCRQHSGGTLTDCQAASTSIPTADRPDTKGGTLDPGPKQRPPRDTISTGGGILEPGPGGFGPQSPAATGAPLSTGRGSAPPPGQIK